ncbi:GUN4 domain-containing protein [Cyanobium sp. Morenito 9A2]|uniref:GUN4 domain-containing protein n=1 Tax=Cyanobium sp. Morenito 9A2 TaxID=2823718 RepID=UPI0020CCC192|nr:GUN4 domain-containing protein [Cyanobium sp. Morenito 9A2]MCP9849031.1 GUN4 domain-containing protein [Cyanobium sp. Morenito 9A2]
MTDPIERRLAALEAALAALTGRLESLTSQVHQHEENLSLVSDVARYTPLRDLLAAGRIQEADEQTERILFDCINSSLDDVTPEDIETFPVTPLRILDQIWRSHSGDRFGFGVQLRIYRELGGTIDTLIAQDVELHRAFCERIGWSRNGQPIEPQDQDVSETAATGALPRRCWSTPYGMKITNLILARLITAGF